MVYRYQNALRDDAGLRDALNNLRPEYRRILPLALACLCAVLLLLARTQKGLGRYVFIAAGSLAALLFAARFLAEHRIVSNWAAAVGTVLLFRKHRRRSAAIKYAFKGPDGLVYLGNATGSAFLPKEGATLGVIYRVDNPSRSLLLSKFLFYEFARVPMRGRTGPSEGCAELKADS